MLPYRVFYSLYFLALFRGFLAALAGFYHIVLRCYPVSLSMPFTPVFLSRTGVFLAASSLLSLFFTT